MPIIIASNFGDLAAAGMVGAGLLIASIISVVSLLLVIPTTLRKKGRWHGWLAVICAVTFFVFASFMMSTLQRSLEWSDLWLFLLFCVPAAVASVSLYVSRKKPNQSLEPTRFARGSS